MKGDFMNNIFDEANLIKQNQKKDKLNNNKKNIDNQKLNEEKNEYIVRSFRIPKKYLNELKQIAIKEDRKVNNLVNKIIKDFLNK